ncbi:hypothetical protein [Neolewinella litorea]|uniref:Uncharacterized protein n=1 Tax=Neolewinella litorea TaxID=2562452 RepID=A0A4S4NKW4_9BACT|nr:hypothetical protein [Neolewinella litorea]THH40534.1 hypothetical protein E4021_07300 [Neolewinella litorea]
MPRKTPPTPGIYLQDLYHPRRCISHAYFSAFTLLLAVMPVLLFFGVPTVLAVWEALGRGPSDGLLFGHPPITYAPYIYPWVFLLYIYVVATVCVNRMRATGRSLLVLLVPGYNLYVLFLVADRLPGKDE